MNRSEVAQLFAYCCLFDTRLQADEGRILAWDSALYPEMTFEFAKEFVSRHYMNEDKLIAPVHFNKGWMRHEEREKERLRTEQYMLELEQNRATAASPEVVDFYLSQIREVLAKGKPSADMAEGNGEVASDL